jgi:magnesium chelatase family protein
VLSANRIVAAARLDKTVLLGVLALDGRIRPVRGVLADDEVMPRDIC